MFGLHFFRREGRDIVFMIAGLGNPTPKYEKTRHNVGFDVIDALAEKYDIKIKSKKCNAYFGQGMAEGQKILLVKPQTFMNNSGDAIRGLLDFYKLDPARQLLVIYDDISLSPGDIRLRAKGSAGGHNGIKNIIARIGTQEFARIKVGIGEKPEQMELADYVLGRFAAKERELVEKAIQDAVCAAGMVVSGDITKAMNRYNAKKKS